MARKLTNDRALRIMGAATEEFSKRGFHGARVDHIARRAGVNKQLLFYYYHSKRGLFHATLARAAAALERALEAVVIPPGRPVDRIRDALSAQFDFLTHHPELVALISHAGRSDAGSDGGLSQAGRADRCQRAPARRGRAGPAGALEARGSGAGGERRARGLEHDLQPDADPAPL